MTRLRALQIPLVLTLFAFLIWRIGIGDVRRAFADVDPWLAAAVIALNVPLAVLFAIRSHMVLVRMGHHVPPAVLVSIAVLGNVAGALTPASSGEVLRATALRSHAGVPGRDGAALVLFERVLSLYLMALGTAIAAACLFLPAWAGAIAVAAALPLAALPVVAAPLLRFVPTSNDNSGSPSGFMRTTLRSVADVAGQLRRLFGDMRLVLEWGLVTAAIFATITLQFWLLARSLSGAIGAVQMWVAFGASQLAGIASLVPLGLGASDGSLAALLHRMGMSLGQGTVVAILVRATSTMPQLLLALASYLYLLRRVPLPKEGDRASLVSPLRAYTVSHTSSRHRRTSPAILAHMPHESLSHVDRQRDHFEGKPTIFERLLKNPDFPRTTRKKIQFVGQALAGCERILEVGTGRGIELDLLLSTAGHGVEYVGIDLATAPLRDTLASISSERRGSISLLASVVEQLPFHDKAFDGIFCVDVLHHAQSQETMLRELRRVLKPGGKLLCVEPNRLYPANVIYVRNPVENGLFKFTHEAGRRWASAAGLSEVEIISLPVFFPSFPSAFAGAYAGVERVLGALPGIRDISTTRVLIARRPTDTAGAP